MFDFSFEYSARGVGIVGINSNDVLNYPQDRPELMKGEKLKAQYFFPYLFDEDQSVALAYKATCTPDFFLFDQERKLVYRGQFDDSRPGSSIPVTGQHLREACDSLLNHGYVKDTLVQKPSIGCNIKWKEGVTPNG